MKQCNLEDFIGEGPEAEATRLREKIVAIYSGVTPEVWAQLPLVASAFFNEFEGALIFQPIVDQFGKISELYFLTNVNHFKLDDGALFLRACMFGGFLPNRT